MAAVVSTPAGVARGLVAGDTVVLAPGGTGGNGGNGGNGSSGGDPVAGTVVDVTGQVVTLRCPSPAAAPRFAGGRAVEVVSLSRELTATASVLAEPEIGSADARGELVITLRLGETLQGTESRSWTRVPVEVPVCVSSFASDGLRNFVGRTRNLSVGGLLMHSFAPVPAGPVVAVVHLDGRHRLAVLAETLETSRPRDGERGWMARLQFVASQTGVVEVIREFVVRALVEQRPSVARASSGCDELADLRNATRRGDPRPRW